MCMQNINYQIEDNSERQTNNANKTAHKYTAIMAINGLD